MSTNYAIVNIYGRQYKVREGDKVRANYFEADLGAKVTLSDVVMVNLGSDLKFGAPLVSGAKVTATVDSHIRAEKVIVFKYRQKNKYKRTYGHRQPYTVLNIDKIEG